LFKSIVEDLFRKFDINCDHRLTFNEFQLLEKKINSNHTYEEFIEIIR